MVFYIWFAYGGNNEFSNYLFQIIQIESFTIGRYSFALAPKMFMKLELRYAIANTYLIYAIISQVS